jgi:hypothetical protein
MRISKIKKLFSSKIYSILNTNNFWMKWKFMSRQEKEEMGNVFLKRSIRLGKWHLVVV